jgi:4,5-dihydroxyphthalate decarboxylase
LTFAAGLYDRMLPLHTGEVEPDGIALRFTPIDEPRVLFDRILAGEFDAGELSSSEFVRRFGGGDRTFVAIPVFPSRVFRHGMICVRRDAGITEPRQLEHRRVGVPSYPMTAAVWIRGLLRDEYQVDHRTIAWVEAKDLGGTMTAALEAGEIDAFIGADIPEEMRRSPQVVRLFLDYREREREYYRRTRIFPIMHTVVIRREVYERAPFVAPALFDALSRAKDVARERMRYMGTLRYMLPWMISEIEEIDEVFGGDPWVYGVEPNRPTLDALISHLLDQGFLSKPFACDDLFVPVRDVAVPALHDGRIS